MNFQSPDGIPASSEYVVLGMVNAAVLPWPPPNTAYWPDGSTPPSADGGTGAAVSSYAFTPLGMVTVSGTAELSKVPCAVVTERPAILAWCRMVMLPVLAGTLKLIWSPTLCMGNACTAGYAGVTTGRVHAAGVQAAA